MKTAKNPTFPLIIGIVSLISLYKISLYWMDIYSIISVITGLTGIFLFYSGNKNYDRLFYAWIFMQVPNFYFTNSSGTEIPILNAFPTSVLPVSFNFGLHLGLKDGELSLSLHLIPIFLYFLMGYLNISKSVGLRVSIDPLRKGSFSETNFPGNGVIERIAGRDKRSGIYMVTLDEPLMIKNKPYKQVLIDSKYGTLIKTTDENQICALRLCESADVVYNEKQNPILDWVIVQVK